MSAETKYVNTHNRAYSIVLVQMNRTRSKRKTRWIEMPTRCCCCCWIHINLNGWNVDEEMRRGEQQRELRSFNACTLIMLPNRKLVSCISRRVRTELNFLLLFLLFFSSIRSLSVWFVEPKWYHFDIEHTHAAIALAQVHTSSLPSTIPRVHAHHTTI